MASTYTSRINLELQADGENPNSWGDILNNNVIQLVDDAVAAYTSVTLSSTDYTLTTNDGSTDQARSAMLEIVGTVSSDSNLIIPGVSKFYIVKDRSVRQNDAAIKIKTAAGSGFTVAASATRVVICDSVSVYGTDSIGATVCVTNLIAQTGSFTACVSTTNLVAATGNFSACVSTTNLVAATGSFTTKVSGVASEFSSTVCVGTSVFAVGGVFSGNVSASTFAGDGSAITNVVPQNYLSGLTLSNDSGDTDHDLSIDSGICNNSTNATAIELSSAIVKRIDASWVAGTGNGGLASSLTLAANTTYHVFAIVVSGSADAGFDTSPTAANLVTDHSATAFRRIGSVLTDASSNIRQFKQSNDTFLLEQPILTYPSVNIGNTARTTIGFNVPVSVSVEAMFTHLKWGHFTEASYVYRPLSMTDVSVVDLSTTAPTSAAMGSLGQRGAGYVEFGDNARLREFAWSIKCETDLKGQIGVRTQVTGGSADGGDKNSFQTLGWDDYRDK
jgi:hypothetical protein